MNDVSDGSRAGKLGTFAGVFTPSVLTILGLILFLRLEYVVGGAGLARALGIILIANAISLITSMSVAAIATNLKVKSGGDYYLISRTLGLRFGGAIGIVLFCAQSVSVGFYCIGFASATAELLSWEGQWAVRTLAAMAVALLFVPAWLGSDWASRFQYIIMAVMAAALLSFAAGAFQQWDGALLAGNWSAPGDGGSFWLIFAIFFPAVTGFTQGVSMSGDLREPGRSIPLGTFLALSVSFAIYVGCAVALAASRPLDVLADDPGSMKSVSMIGPLIDAGVIAATLSSGLASFLGAPRILQALANDRVFPALRPFARGSGAANNPRRGVLLSAAIALAIIALGSLDLVASIVTMFFLVSYGLLNYATYFEARAASPSFRPRFRWFDYRLSLLGGFACLGAMLAIDVWASLTAIVILFAIFQYVKHEAVRARWADSQRSYHLQQVREHLLSAAADVSHPRDWRPQLLVFADDPRRRAQLARFASWVEGGSGLTTVVRLLEGDGEEILERKKAAANELAHELKEHGSKAFSLVVSGHNLDEAVATVIQSAGLGPLKANTAVVNWFNEGHGFFGALGGGYTRNLQTTFRHGCNLLVLDVKDGDWETTGADSDPGDAEARGIDVWWYDNKTGELMLLLAYLMSRAEAWRGATIRLLSAPKEHQGAAAREAELREMLADFRIDAEPVVVEDATAECIHRYSRDAAVVFIPMTIRASRCYHLFGGEVGDLLPNLPTVVMTLAAQDVDLDAEPESGTVRESAAARDRVEDAADLLNRLGKQLERAESEIAEETEKLKALGREGAAEETMNAQRAWLDRLRAAAGRTRRRAARVAAFREAAEKRMADVDIEVEGNHAPDRDRDARKGD
jgi:amino acid transporter